MRWEDAEPGEYSVLLVGAGFPIAVLCPRLPSTPDLIEHTATNHGSDFPLISALYKSLGNNTKLDDVWSTIDGVCKSALSIPCGHPIPLPFDGPWLVRQASQAYAVMLNNPLKGLFDSYNNDCNKDKVASVVLGVELKRMLALHYDQSKVRPISPPLPRLKRLIESLDDAAWVSLNYDLALEKVLDDCLSHGAWRYAFQGLFEPDHWESPKAARHIIVKPHGSLNLSFKTVGRTHSVTFCDKTNRLATCDWKAVGALHPFPQYDWQEERPCLIGYLPDCLKDEINTPGNTADASHDFAKWNLTHAGLSLHRATSIFILGYSLPVADDWMWARLNRLSDKTIPVYVASRNDSAGIVTRLQTAGFAKAAVLGNGDIC